MKLETVHESPLEMAIRLLHHLADALLGWIAGLLELFSGIPMAILDRLADAFSHTP